MEIIDYLTKTNYKKKSGKKNKYIIIHYTANDGDTAWGNCHYFYEEYRGASANYFVDEKSIYRCVKDEDVAWGVNQTWNNQSIHIELCSRNTKSDKSGTYYFLGQTIENAVWLTKYLMEKWNVPVQNVLRHYDCTGKLCPKPMVEDENMWLRFKEDITPNPNKAKFDYLGISAFHKAGYLGQGIMIASRENNTTTHGAMVEDIIRQIAPMATTILKENYQKGTYADVYTTSSFYNSDTYKQHKETAAKLYGNNVLLCCAVGNEGDSSQTELSKNECWTSIGACDLENLVPKRMYYSSITPDLDFVSLTNLMTEKGKFTGTSCATPVFASMCVLVQQFFEEKIGRKLTNHELLNFVKRNCVDLYEDGKDDKTGYGLFVLPEPSSINIEEYLEEEDYMGEKYGYTVYNDFDALPAWGRDAVEKAIKLGILKGTGNGLGLTETELKTMVWFDRLGLLNKPNPQEDDIILPSKQ